jgi:hypothetical protein
MHKFAKILLTIGLSAVLAACGGESDNDTFRDPAPPVVGPPPANTQVASIQVTTSAPTISSDGTQTAEIKAFVRDAQNRFVSGATVAFAASSGGIQVQQGTSQADGSAIALLSTAGDPSTRAITVTASAGTLSSTVTVNVVGTRISIQGPASLTLQQSGQFTVAVINSADAGIAGRQVTLTSVRGNAITPASVTTDANGRANFTVAISQPGNDTITATTSGATGTAAIAVAADNISFVSPALNAEIPLNTGQLVTVRLSGAPAGTTVNFATTRGVVSPATATTNAAGEASTTIQSGNAGGVAVTATATVNSTALSVQRTFEYVASTPASIDVQPSSFTIGINEEATLTAVVRDAAGNLVKNRTVQFNLQDVTGGTLTTPSAVTDSQGRAQSVYRAGSTVSAANGVTITTTIAGFPAVTDSVQLTVARKELFISLGTGNTIEEPNIAQYRLQYAVQVTDAAGNGVRNVPVVMSILSVDYFKGLRVVQGTAWTTQINAVCQDEDLNRNGVLDGGEDFNSSGRIEAGNIATVTRNVVTNDNGIATVDVLYPQEYAFYLEVELEARAATQGTEFARAARFVLPGAASDFNTVTTAPPGPTSPFGVQNNCALAN